MAEFLASNVHNMIRPGGERLAEALGNVASGLVILDDERLGALYGLIPPQMSIEAVDALVPRIQAQAELATSSVMAHERRVRSAKHTELRAMSILGKLALDDGDEVTYDSVLSHLSRMKGVGPKLTGLSLIVKSMKADS